LRRLHIDEKVVALVITPARVWLVSLTGGAWRQAPDVLFPFAYLPDPVNFFQNTPVTGDGIIHRLSSTAKPGEAFDFTLFAPRQTPDEIVARLEYEVRNAITTNDFKDRFAAQDLWVLGTTGKDTEVRLEADSKLWADVIKRTGMKID
jgi:hypothetical protein